MRKIKDVLRLKYDANLNHRQIAASLKLSVGVISKYAKAAEAAGLSWPLPDGLDCQSASNSLLADGSTLTMHLLTRSVEYRE